MKTILATAYAINPYKGSEDGMGWNFTLQMARFNKVIAVTRENNREHIEKYMAEQPNKLYDNIQFLYYDLPYWMRFWKKGGRGAMLYYLMWQRGIVSFIEKQQLKFDITHNLNFHNDWTPSFLWKLKKPFVWGPVGHHPQIPTQYLKPYAFSYRIKECLTWWVKQYFWKFSPALSDTKKHANHVICMNSSVPNALKISTQYAIIPSVATQDFGWKEPEIKSEKFSVISAGRFVPLKGFDLTIRAFAKFFHELDIKDQSKCELCLVGSGPEESFLKALAEGLSVKQNIKFISWIERKELMEKFKEASAFLFPSHEGAGMVVAEALSFGLPIVCLANEGPGEFIDTTCGFAISSHNNYEATVNGLSASLQELFKSPAKQVEMSLAARRLFESKFHWDRRGEQLQKIYATL
jgi:glycosyltransferase involved in cell wall biosynthesis